MHPLRRDCSSSLTSISGVTLINLRDQNNSLVDALPDFANNLRDSSGDVSPSAQKSLTSWAVYLKPCIAYGDDLLA